MRRLWVIAGLLATVLVHAAEELNTSNALTSLRPPRPVMPPDFWEQYGAWAVAGGVFVILAAVGLVVYARKPKPTVTVPPQVEARNALEGLRGRPEDGGLLSRVSQVLRHYMAAAFDLPPGEMTTAEFTRAIALEERIGPELSRLLGEFLHKCDERKFAPKPDGPTPGQEPTANGAVAKALQIIDIAEGRRASLTHAAQSSENETAPPMEKPGAR